MDQEDSLKILFVINPRSGGKVKRDWKTAIIDYFSPLSYYIDFYILTGTDDLMALQQWIKKMRPDRVVAIGGDGTVSFVAKQLLGTSMALGILPGGSANGMAKELGVPEVIEDALKMIASGTVRDADVIRINKEHICLHLSDIGLNAQLIKYFEEGKLRGKLGYASVVLKTLWRKSPIKICIQTGDREIMHSALMVVLANASKYGTGAVINPNGDLYDGLFEVVIVKRLAISELIKMLIKPKPFDPKKIQLFHATAVTIKTKKKVHFQVDGEYLGKINQIDANILHGKLKLIVPDQQT